MTPPVAEVPGGSLLSQPVATEGAPAQEPVGAPVGDATAGSSGEVPEGAGSAADPNLIPKARFDGLMGRFHQEQSRVKALEDELAALRKPAEEPAPIKETEVSDAAIQSLQEQVAALTRLLVEKDQQSNLDAARAQALKDYPKAEKLADLILGDTPEEIAEMAKVIHERLSDPPGNSAGSATPETTGANVPESPPVVLGGGAPAPGESTWDERISAARKSGDISAVLQLKYERQMAESGGTADLTL